MEERKMTKVCPKCGWLQGIIYFRRDKNSIDGYKGICRFCEDKIINENAKSGGKNPFLG